MKNPRAVLKCYDAKGMLCRSFGATTRMRYRALVRVANEAELRQYHRQITRARDGVVLLVLEAKQ